MTAVDTGASRDPQPGGESVSPSVPSVTTLPSGTTLPPRPAQRARPRQPRQLTMIRLRDVLSLIGALVAAVATTGMLWQEISPFSGILGYIVVTWVLFVFYYTVLISFDENQPTVRDRVSAVVVQSLGALVLVALVAVIWYTFLKGFAGPRAT